MTGIPTVFGLQVPNLLPRSILTFNVDWIRPAGRLIISTVITVGALGVAFIWARRPKSPEPATWAQAMLGATAVFGLMLVGYGVLPHEWITFANSYLQWDRTHFLLERSNVAWFPFDIDMAAIADIGVVVIYGVMVAANLLLWSLWQKREVATPAAEPAEAERVESGTSAYGRPLTQPSSGATAS
jgi:hypothetical protein